MAKYGWLKEAQEKERKSGKKDADRTAIIVMAGAPLSQRYGMGGGSEFIGNTGFGEDGQLQPSMPTNMVNTQNGQRLLHEGEDITRNGNGSFNVTPANQSQLSQQQLIGLQKQGMQGYQEGVRGISIGGGDDLVDTIKKKTNTIKFKPSENTGAFKTDTTTDNFGTGTFKPSSGIGDKKTDLEGGEKKDTTSVVRSKVGTDGTPQEVDQIVTPPAPLPGTFGEPVTQTTTTTQQPPAGTIYGTPGDRALQRVEGYAEGRDPTSQALRDYYFGELRGEQAAGLGALSQTAAQVGLTPREAATEAALQRRDYLSAETELGAKLAQQEGDRAFQAAMKIPGLIEAKERWEGTKDWDAFLRAAEYGDDAAVSAAYETVFGQPLTDQAMVNDIRSYARTKREQDVTIGGLQISAQEIANRGAELGITGEQYRQAWAMANQGITDVGEINRALGLNLTQSAFDNVINSTPWGQVQYGRQLDQVNMLLQAGGEQNLGNAATMLNDMFPGLNIDFSRVVDAENAADFSNGMGTLAALVASGMDWTDAQQALEATGALGMLGMKMGDIENLYNAMDMNVIDEQWSTISDSAWFQGLSTEDQQDVQDLFDAEQSGRLDFKVLHEFLVTDKDGTTHSVWNEADAQAYVNEHPESSYEDTGNTRISMVDRLSGDVIDGFGGSGDGPDSADIVAAGGETYENASDVPSGTYYSVGGNLFLATGGEPESINTDSVLTGDFDPLGVDIDATKAILSIGPDNPLYNTVLGKVVEYVINPVNNAHLLLSNLNLSPEAQTRLAEGIAANPNTQHVEDRLSSKIREVSPGESYRYVAQFGSANYGYTSFSGNSDIPDGVYNFRRLPDDRSGYDDSWYLMTGMNGEQYTVKNIRGIITVVEGHHLPPS